MADSQLNTDWDAVRLMALQCLSAAENLVGWAERSRGGDYDTKSAAWHLGAIDSAVETLRRATRTFTGGVKVRGRSFVCGSALFDAIAMASAGEKERPIFRVGGTHCATAHQNAYLLLRMVLVRFEGALVDDAVVEYFDHVLALLPEAERGWRILRTLSPEALREMLINLEKIAQLAWLPIEQSSADMLESFIDREWAAVNHDAAVPVPNLTVKGVSLRDAAERIRPDDCDGQKELIKSWRNLRRPKLPEPIGKCPHHSQTNLYEPTAIVEFLKRVEGPEVDVDFGLSAHFRKVSRFPRSK